MQEIRQGRRPLVQNSLLKKQNPGEPPRKASNLNGQILHPHKQHLRKNNILEKQKQQNVTN